MTAGGYYRKGRFYKFKDILIGGKPVAATAKIKRFTADQLNHRLYFTLAPNFKSVIAFILAGYFGENDAVSVNWFGINVGRGVTVRIEVASREGELIDRALSAVNGGVQGYLLAAFRR